MAQSKKLQKVPCLFVSHGGPPLVFPDGDMIDKETSLLYQNDLTKYGQYLDSNYDIKGIISISAHYEFSKSFAINDQENPQTIHDHGFSDYFYFQYNAKGDPQLALQLKNSLEKAGLSSKLDSQWGFDHGCWSPLKLLFPKADKKVIQISLNTNYNQDQHIQLGIVLSEYRNNGYLILGSGSVTHNLGQIFQAMNTNSKPKDYDNFKHFEQWMSDVVLKKNGKERIQEILKFRSIKSYKISHPTDDHFYPILVTLGCAGDSNGKIIHDSFPFSGISLACYTFE